MSEREGPAGGEADEVGRRAARKAAKRPRSEAKPSEAWAPAKAGRRAKASLCMASYASRRCAGAVSRAMSIPNGHAPVHA